MNCINDARSRNFDHFICQYSVKQKVQSDTSLNKSNITNTDIVGIHGQCSINDSCVSDLNCIDGQCECPDLNKTYLLFYTVLNKRIFFAF